MNKSIIMCEIETMCDLGYTFKHSANKARRDFEFKIEVKSSDHIVHIGA